MINIPYHVSRYLAKWNRARFVERLSRLAPIIPSQKLPVTVYSFSGEKDWPEQAASIRSFLRFVGLPSRFVVVSDGSHSDESLRRLEAIHSHVSVTSLDSIVPPDLPPKVA